MGTREKIFAEEAGSLFDELVNLVEEMKDDGICMTDDLRRIADELDELWKEVNQGHDIDDDTDLDEEDNNEDTEEVSNNS